MAANECASFFGKTFCLLPKGVLLGEGAGSVRHSELHRHGHLRVRVIPEADLPRVLTVDPVTGNGPGA